MTSSVIPQHAVGRVLARPLSGAMVEAPATAAAATPAAAAGLQTLVARDAVLELAGPSAEGEVTRAVTLRLSPEILGRLVARPPVPPQEQLPLADSRRGNLFTDRVDPGVSWFLPGFALVDRDPAFAFQALQTSLDGSGHPFHRAKLTLDVRTFEPPDVVADRAARPAATFRPIPLLDVDITLQLPYTDDGGVERIKPFAGRVEPAADGGYSVVFEGLLGEDVLLCYAQLRLTGTARLLLSIRYRVCRAQHAPPRFPAMFDWWRVQQANMAPELLAPDRALRPMGAVTGRNFVLLQRWRGLDPADTAADPGTPDPATTDPAPASVELDQIDEISLELGTTFGTGDYPSRFTLTVGTTTSVIVDERDLIDFHVQRSEYRELTSLGDVQAAYPSFRRVYIGVVTGTVVAVPVTYGITRGAWGCGASCDAIVDERANSLSGCLFHLMFALAPVVDPIDLARLAHDLLGTPEAAAQEKLNLRLPSGLDPRVLPTLQTPLASSIAFADGLSAHSLLLSVTIEDGDVPAINKVNLFLTALCASVSTPLFGQVTLRLDDVFTPPVQTSAILNFHSTSGDNSDIATSLGGTPLQATVTNTAPFGLQLGRYGAYGAAGMVVSDLDETLAPGGTRPLGLPGDADADTAVLVQRSLALGQTVPKGELSRYLAFHTETVAKTKFALGLNATGVSLPDLGASEMSVQIALTNLPQIAVQPMVITPAHRIDSVSLLVPIDAVVNGLAATVSIRLTVAQTTRDVELTHDFWEEPILVLSQAALA